MSVSPKKSLGQHFLVDRNLLAVIERLANLSSDDVVLEGEQCELQAVGRTGLVEDVRQVVFDGVLGD